MSCEHLICAHCAGPVVEARCPTCRAARAHVHHPLSFGSPPAIIALLLTLLTVFMVVAASVAIR